MIEFKIMPIRFKLKFEIRTLKLFTDLLAITEFLILILSGNSFYISQSCNLTSIPTTMGTKSMWWDNFLAVTAKRNTGTRYSICTTALIGSGL